MAKKLTQKEFITRAQEVHKSKKFDYSKVAYVSMKTKVRIICRSHDKEKEFDISPDNLLQGRGCPECGEIARRKSKQVTYKEFVLQSSAAHKNKYLYGVNRKWKGIKSQVSVICPVHGGFTQGAENHRKGHGCKECAIIERSSREVFEHGLAFAERARKVHGTKYSYKNAEYTKAKNKLNIQCPIHGEFSQEAESHLQGSGCPTCGKSASSAEREIMEFLKDLGHSTISRKRSIIPPMELDIYLPDCSTAIEYNGSYWHDSTKKSKLYHLEKTLAAEKKGIRLIHVFDYVFNRNKLLVFRMLKKLTSGADLAVGARECRVVALSYGEVKEFYVNNHLMGPASGTLHAGLLYKEKLVAAATFKRRSTGGCQQANELVRYCTPPELCVHGGLSKITNYAMRQMGWDSLISYVERTWFTGEMYKKNGWKLVGCSEPGYCYTNLTGTKSFHRTKFMKNKLKSMKGVIAENYSDQLPESEIMKRSGFLRIYDCGMLKLEYRKKSPA